MPKYRLKAVSKITNIPADTIRNWEKRYDFLKPSVGPGGEKMYTDQDVELLRKITVLLKTEGRISAIAAKIFDTGYLDQVDTTSSTVSNEVQLLIEEYYQSILDMDLKKIDQIENMIEITVIFKNRLNYIYYPLLERARKDCAVGAITKAQEHFVTGLIVNKMKGFLSSSVYIHSSQKSSLICCSPSNSMFEGGLLTLACSMKLKGYNIYYLGSNLPVIELSAVAKKLQPAVLAFSIHDPEELSAIVKLYKNAEYPVCVGGIGVRLSDSNDDKQGSVNLISYTGNYAVEKLEAICIDYFESQKQTTHR